MAFLFVGSSGLSWASFPRDLAIPQLPCSSVYAIVLTMTASSTAVFPHEGTFTLPVHAHVRRTQITGANSRPASPFHAGRQFGIVLHAPPFLSAAVAQF